MPHIDLIELVKQAKEAGFSAADINLLVAKEEERYTIELEREEKLSEREERHKERELKKVELEAIEAEKASRRQAEEAEKQRAHELALAQLKADRADDRGPNLTSGSFPGL